MNHIKNKLQNHEIKPSKMAWERIEAELDKEKARIVPINIRWAAAAMLLVLVTGAITYNSLQKSGNQEVVKTESKGLESNIPQTIVPNTVKTETVSSDKNQQTEQNTKVILPKYKVEKTKEMDNFVQVPLQIIPQNTVPIEEKKNKVVRPQLENPNVIAKNNFRFLELKAKNIDIPRVIENEDEEDEEVAYDNLKLPKLLNQAEGDSTLTEKIITLGQIKAKQVVAKAFQPVLKRFNR